MNRNLKEEERKEILILKEQGYNISQISRELNITRRTTSRWIKRNADEGIISDRPRASRPSMLTEDRVAHMLNTYELKPLTNTLVFAKMYNCSSQSIRTALHRAGIHHRRPKSRITLTETQKQARVSFAREFRDFDFSHAIFSDEKTFKSSEQGRRILWRVNNTRSKPSKSNNEPERVIVNIWAWMSADGPGELVYVDQKANGQTYVDLLEDVMVPTVRTVYPREILPQFYFFQGNCRIHHARVVQNWFHQQPEIITIPWPAISLDLNPVENLWSIIIQRWDCKNERTQTAFVSHCDKVWDTLRGSNVCAELVRSMRDRCDAIINARGALTKC